MEIIEYILKHLFFAFAGGVIAERKNGFWVGFWCSLVAGPFGWGIAWVYPHAFDKPPTPGN
jgi:hypothetical protein